MLFNIGFIVVFASVIIGFLGSGGNLRIITQPLELLMIVGTGIGSFIIATPKNLIFEVLKSLSKLRNSQVYNKSDYTNLLVFMFDFFKFARSNSLVELEKHIDNPSKSAILNKHPGFSKHKEPFTFFCDFIRMQVLGFENPYELDGVMDSEIEMKKEHNRDVSGSLLKLADSLPAIGIVAAVLGVISAMAAVGSAPEILAVKIATALVGTFLGVFFSYGVVGPIGLFLARHGKEEVRYIECLRNALLSHFKGFPPSISVEIARQSIPVDLKPSFLEVEKRIEKIRS